MFGKTLGEFRFLLLEKLSLYPKSSRCFNFLKSICQCHTSYNFEAKYEWKLISQVKWKKTFSFKIKPKTDKNIEKNETIIIKSKIDYLVWKKWMGSWSTWFWSVISARSTFTLAACLEKEVLEKIPLKFEFLQAQKKAWLSTYLKKLVWKNSMGGSNNWWNVNNWQKHTLNHSAKK